MQNIQKQIVVPEIDNISILPSSLLPKRTICVSYDIWQQLKAGQDILKIGRKNEDKK